MTTSAQLITWLKSNTARRCVLVEVYAEIAGVETPLYLSDKGYTTKTAETPANTFYKDIISGTLSFSESISISGDTSFSVGTIELSNKDGKIDNWQNYIFHNRQVKIFIGDQGWQRSEFYQVFDGIVSRLDCDSRDSLLLVLGDKLAKLNTVVSENKLGGTSANKDKVIPLMFGQCFNVTPLLVDVANHEYQIHDGPIEDIIEVRDNGVPVSITKFNSTGKFRLNQQPVGTITCSAHGDKPSTYSNDVVSLVKRLVKDYGKAGQRFVDADLNLTSLATFAAANQQSVGIYLDDKANVMDVCNKLASSIGARLVMSRGGLLSLVKIDLPQATAGTPITSADMLNKKIYISQIIPIVAAIKLAYCVNYTPQSALQTGIPDNHIELFAQENLTVTSVNSTVATKYRLFTDPNLIETQLLITSEAEAEALRLANIWTVQRRVVNYSGEPYLVLEELGASQTITHPRFNLQAGVRGQIIDISIDWLSCKVDIGVIV